MTVIGLNGGRVEMNSLVQNVAGLSHDTYSVMEDFSSGSNSKRCGTFVFL